MSGVDDRAVQAARAVECVARQPVVSGAPDGVVGALQRLCNAMVVALSASGAGVSVMAESGGRGVAAASDPASEEIEEHS
jgi:hypothetical protein